MQTVHLSPSEIGSAQLNSSAVITYHISISRRTLLIPTHVRLPKHPDSPLLSSSTPSELYERRACLLGVEKDYTKKKDKAGTEGERDRVNTLCGIHPWLIRLTFLSRDESNNDEGASLERGGSGGFGGCSGRDTAVVRTLEYPRINESCEILLDFHLIIFDGQILCCLFNLNLITRSSISPFCLSHNFNIH